jgi:hypothetical protein
VSDLIVRGRYQIVPAGETKAVAYTRVTNFAKKLEDGFTLTAWKQRMVLSGAAQRTDIIAATLAAQAGLASTDPKVVKASRDELNRLADAAIEAAQGYVGRETGSALHELCEQVDAGMTVEMPSPWKEDIAAYTDCLQTLGAKVLRSEEVVVVPKLNLAGRFDRLLDIGGTTYVMDIKTGADLSYSWASIAIQLAVYALADTIYHHEPGDPESCSHEPMPRVDQSRALVIHLPAGKAEAVPYWVNLEAGRRGIDLVESVTEWRKQKEVAVRYAELEAAPQFVARDDLRAYASARVRDVIDAGHGTDLAGVWPLGVPTLKAFDDHDEAQLDSILAACSLVEMTHSMPFPTFDDPRQFVTKQASKQATKRSKAK